MNEFFDFIKNFNVQTVISMFAVMWYFSRDIKAQIDEFRKEVREDIKVQSDRTDKLYQQFGELQQELNIQCFEMRKEMYDFQKLNDMRFYEMLKSKAV